MKRKFIPRCTVIFAKKMVYKFYHLSEKILQPPFDKYDFQTFDVLKMILRPSSNCIDVGAHKGEILAKIIQNAPRGKHYAFEPIPFLYAKLQKRFSKRVALFNLALAEQEGSATFTIFKDRPAVSGLRERKFDGTHYETEKIQVNIARLDDKIPEDVKIDLIKIDVEGAELGVIKGAERILKNDQPVLLFEFGKGGSDLYGTTPEQMFDFLARFGYTISTQEYFLKKLPGFAREEFIGQYEKGYNFFFIAYPADILAR